MLTDYAMAGVRELAALYVELYRDKPLEGRDDFVSLGAVCQGIVDAGGFPTLSQAGADMVRAYAAIATDPAAEAYTFRATVQGHVMRAVLDRAAPGWATRRTL